MIISEMIEELEQAKKDHGDIPIFLADRYAHYDIKRAEYSSATKTPHFCIRMRDDIKYDD